MDQRVLIDWVRYARRRTLELVADLSDEQLFGPRLSIINPLMWEIGHLAWFQEKWVLRHASRQPPIRANADALYDSAAIPHHTRWDLSLPSVPSWNQLAMWGDLMAAPPLTRTW